MAKREVTVEIYEVSAGDKVVSVQNGQGWTIPVNSTVISVNDSLSTNERSFEFDSNIILGLDAWHWRATVEREEKLATYYFRTHESQTTYLYTSGRLFDNASVVVDEDGVVHKAVFDG